MSSPQKKPSPLIEILVNVVIPSVILMKLSSPERLGTVNALLLALAFPILYGGYDLVRNHKVNYIAILGLVSVLLTGGIGLLKLDVKWLAIKEAAIPAIIGLAVIMTGFTRSPLVRKLIFNPLIMATEKIQHRLADSGMENAFDQKLRFANHCLAGTFVFSAIMNFLLAKMIVTSDAGTVAFNEELGKMTIMSYPVIAIPSMIMLLGIMWYVMSVIKKLTGLSLEEIFDKEN
jgi:hypothetical protein